MIVSGGQRSEALETTRFGIATTQQHIQAQVSLVDGLSHITIRKSHTDDAVVSEDASLDRIFRNSL